LVFEPSVPLPNATTLIQQTVLQQRLAESKEQDYVFRVDTNDIRLRSECTWAPKCPGDTDARHPVAVGFQVLRYSERHFEIFWLDGIRVARVLPSCEQCKRGRGPVEYLIKNVPISDSELAAENQRVDTEVAEARALLAQGKNPSSSGDPPQILFSRMLQLCIFSNPRREILNGRTTILLDFAWNPSVEPASANESLIKFFSGTVEIDEAEHAVLQVEGRFMADVKLERGDIKIRKGTRVRITNRRVDAGIWLLSELEARGEGHYFTFAINGDGHVFTGTYRKFQATSRILP
jgi:hypothetical protein